MWGWHVPGPYQLALQVPFWHGVEHVTFFAGSLLFWWSVVQAVAVHRRTGPRGRSRQRCSSPTCQNTVIAAILTFSGAGPVSRLRPGPAPRGPLGARRPGHGRRRDVGAGIAGVPRPRDRRDGSPALPGQPSSPEDRADAAASHRPGRGSICWRHRSSVRSCAHDTAGTSCRARFSCVAAAVIADGLLGDQMAAMNLAGVLPWTYWRFFVIVGLLAVGNVFCMACPFMLPRELGRRLGLATRHWPHAAAIEVAGRRSAGALLLGLRGARAVGQPALDRLDRRRLLRRRLRGRHAVPRRQLLQVRLPHRAIPFRELARLAVRGAAEATECLRHLRHARLPAWQRPAARM